MYIKGRKDSEMEVGLGYVDESERAVECFMRSPKSYNARKSVAPAVLNASLAGSFGSPAAGKRNLNLSKSLQAYKKTGVVFTKCY